MTHIVATLALALTLLGGVLHGRLTHRWGEPVDYKVLGQMLSKLPKDIGPWRLQSQTPLSDQTVDVLQCAGYVNRVYIHESTGAQVAIALLVGPPGPMSVHVPEICYSSRNYKQLGERAISSPDQQSEDELWGLSFAAVNGMDRLRVLYGWSDGSSWSAPASPRLTYGGRQYLYKVQLASHDERAADGSDVPDPCSAFFFDARQALQKCMRSPAAGSGSHTEHTNGTGDRSDG